MNTKQFQNLVDTYGADLAAWPERQLAKARLFIVASPEARRMLNAAAQLDALWQENWEFPGDAAAISQRLAHQALVSIDISKVRHTPMLPWIPRLRLSTRFPTLEAGAFATAALIIFLFGAHLGEQSAGITEQGTVQSLILDGPYRSYAAL